MDKRQKEFIQRNNAKFEASQPDLAILRRRLLKAGGAEVVLRPTLWLDKILSRAKLSGGSSARFIRGEPSRCHSNSCLLSDGGERHHVITGYALSSDGLWRQHTWMKTKKSGWIIETTEPREKYFGYELGGGELEEFVSNVLAGTQFE